jgi:hypothetical protein
MGWTCTNTGTDGGNDMCPADVPIGDPCTIEGQTCVYSGGHTVCTCSVADGWMCQASKR